MSSGKFTPLPYVGDALRSFAFTHTFPGMSPFHMFERCRDAQVSVAVLDAVDAALSTQDLDGDALRDSIDGTATGRLVGDLLIQRPGEFAEHFPDPKPDSEGAITHMHVDLGYYSLRLFQMVQDANTAHELIVGGRNALHPKTAEHILASTILRGVTHAIVPHADRNNAQQHRISSAAFDSLACTIFPEYDEDLDDIKHLLYPNPRFPHTASELDVVNMLSLITNIGRIEAAMKANRHIPMRHFLGPTEVYTAELEIAKDVVDHDIPALRANKLSGPLVDRLLHLDELLEMEKTYTTRRPGEA
jgi:hypothetical protein